MTSAARARRLPPPLLLLLLATATPPCAGSPRAGVLPAEPCPRSLDCTLQRREFCPAGSHSCGPCLPKFAEDEHGNCVLKAPASGSRPAVPKLEEEIDLVADALSKQDDARIQTGQRSKAGAPKVQPLAMDQLGSPRTSFFPPTEAVKSSPVESTRLSSNDALILGMIVVCTAAGIAALVVAAICWCRLQKEIRLAQKVEYPAHGLAGPPAYDKISPGDKTLAQSAQMYHYQHQKQQMISMEKHKDEPKAQESASSDEENEDGDFTVYECPGLAPTGEMEVKNPLFDDSSLPLPPAKLHP